MGSSPLLLEEINVTAMQRNKKADATLLSCAPFADHQKQCQKGNALLYFNALTIARCYLKGCLSTSTLSHQPRSAMQRSLSVPEVKHSTTGERAFSVRGHNCELSHEQRDFEEQPAPPTWTEAFCNLADAGRTCPMQLTTSVSKTDLTSQSLSQSYGRFMPGCIVTFLISASGLLRFKKRIKCQLDRNLGKAFQFKRKLSNTPAQPAYRKNKVLNVLAL